MNKTKNLLAVLTLIAISLISLSATFRGDVSLDFYGKSLGTKVGSPFESSNSNARYALTKAIVDDGTFFLSENLASFSAPDIAFYNGKYLSVFTPGLSFVAVPFYLVGKAIGLPQVFSYFVNPLFSILSVLAIFAIARKLSVNSLAAAISALTFLLATNSLTYSQTFTQHSLSTFLLLIMMINALYLKGIRMYLLAGALVALGVLVDIPNLFMMIPATLMVLAKSIEWKDLKSAIKFKVSFKPITIILAALPLIALFAYYNFATTGSPIRLAQFIGRTETVEETKPTITVDEDSGIEFPFYTRLLLNGLYILTVSDERGIFFYSPILIFGVFGLFITYKDEKTKRAMLLALATIGITLLTYAMFGDPWGGWSFGPRYLIPVEALLSIFISVVLAKYAKKFIFTIFFTLILVYSLFVNTLGALTSSSVPPKGEAQSLINPVPYTYEYNWALMKSDRSSSYVYNTRFREEFPLADYFAAFMIAEVLCFSAYYLLLMRRK